MRKHKLLFGRLLLPVALGSAGVTADAASISKASNTTGLNNAASWAGGVAPTSADVAVFDNTIVLDPLTVNQGGNLTWGSIQLTGPAGLVTINQASNTLTLATSGAGIDLSAATADLTFAGTGFVRVANANFNPSFNVAAGRTLTFNGQLTNQGNTKTFQFIGSGNTILNGNAGSGGASSFNLNGSNLTVNGTGGWLGGTVLSGTLNIGNDAGLGGGTLNLGGATADTPTITASGGARTIVNNVTLLAGLAGNPTISGSNNLTINGTVTNSGGSRTLTVNNTGLTTLGGTVNLSNDANNRTLTINGTGNATISGVIANGGTSTASGFTYSGGGTLLLSNTSTYTGATTVSAGTLLVNGALGNTATAVNGTATLGGTGTVGGVVTIAATAFLAAGENGIESLGVGSAVINGRLLTQFDGTDGGTIDLLAAAGNLDISNATLDFSMVGGGAVLNDASYVFATYGSLTGAAFSSVLNLPTGYEINYAFGGNNIALVAVPEPAGALLGLLGLTALFRRRRS